MAFLDMLPARLPCGGREDACTLLRPQASELLWQMGRSAAYGDIRCWLVSMHSCQDHFLSSADPESFLTASRRLELPGARSVRRQSKLSTWPSPARSPRPTPPPAAFTLGAQSASATFMLRNKSHQSPVVFKKHSFSSQGGRSVIQRGSGAGSHLAPP